MKKYANKLLLIFVIVALFCKVVQTQIAAKNVKKNGTENVIHKFDINPF